MLEFRSLFYSESGSRQIRNRKSDAPLGEARAGSPIPLAELPLESKIHRISRVATAADRQRHGRSVARVQKPASGLGQGRPPIEFAAAEAGGCAIVYMPKAAHPRARWYRPLQPEKIGLFVR